MRELTSARMIWLKACLFLLAGTGAGALIVWYNPSWKTAALLIVTVWCFARFYYFAFYAAQRWVDASYRFTGLWSLFAHFILRARRRER